MTPLHDSSMMEILLEIKGDVGEIKGKIPSLVEDVGDLKERVGVLEGSHNKGRGILVALGAAWSAVILGVEYLIRRSH